MLDFHIIHNKNLYVTLIPYQLEELIQYDQKRYHSGFSENIIEVIVIRLLVKSNLPITVHK